MYYIHHDYYDYQGSHLRLNHLIEKQVTIFSLDIVLINLLIY